MSHAPFSDRRWQMRRLAAGDYILPSNDRSVLWRMTASDEPTASGLARTVRKWDLFRWRREAPIVGEDVAFSIVEGVWDEWTCVASGFSSRAEALAEALRLGERGEGQ